MIVKNKYLIELFLKTRTSTYSLHTSIQSATEIGALNKIFEASKKEGRTIAGVMIEEIGEVIIV